MRYEGRINNTCPVCGKQFRFGHPVMYRVDDHISPTGHMWCDTCFFSLYSKYSAAQEKHVESFQELIKSITDIAYQQLTNRQFPTMKGFWFCQFDDKNLGLVVNYSTEE
jgi:hypothetical protein